MHRGIDGMFAFRSGLCSWINKDPRICSRRQLLSLTVTSGLWKSTWWPGLACKCLHTEELSDVSIRFFKLRCVYATYEAPHEQVSLYTTLNRFCIACRSLTENQLWSFRVLWKQRSFTFITSLCLTKLLSSCRVFLDSEPKYGSCNEIYLGEGEGSAGASCCCVTTYFLHRHIPTSHVILHFTKWSLLECSLILKHISDTRTNNVLFKLVEALLQTHSCFFSQSTNVRGLPLSECSCLATSPAKMCAFNSLMQQNPC